MMKTIGLLVLATALAVTPVHADLSVGAALIQYSPDDINTTNIPGLLTLTGDNATANATMPFSIVIGGTSYSTITISTNGWIEFGGNTQGTSDPTNAALPTSKHTNPFLAAYWDDLNPFGDNIRYGVVGTSPDRTYVIDYDVDVDPANEGGSADDIRFQVQIHESSNVINVRYSASGHIANGQSATIGFQGAGGSGATAFPLTFNGKILDDNQPNEGWSIEASRADLGLATMAALMACSPDDIGTDTPAFTTLTGNDAIAGVTMPFSVAIEGNSYSTLTIGTNGLIQFGTTTGANPATNASLPSASFPNPTLFWYWDDLQTSSPGDIRYGTVGTSPNRTFIVDFQGNTVSGTHPVNMQVQVHEQSNLLNVKYRDPTDATANGQSATIGFQGAGGASAVAYPLVFNGKILDDNRHNTEGFSVHPRPGGAAAVHALMEFSPDDISGFTSLSGDNAIAGVTLPFSVTIDGTSYSTATIGTNGLVQFGTTTGANPTTNTALPSASFPNPTLFWYWDDLQTFSSNIQYATVGSGPNRTFIIDFQENRVGDTGNVVNGQVQIHEGSNVMNVKYRSTMSAGANGQSATIGFQGAGGAAAKAYPLTFNGKILDDNLPDSGWSVTPLRYCGDGLVQSGAPFNEQCDVGAGNGAAGSCCTASCTFASTSTSCRAAGGECDVAETCTGTSTTCPTDGKKPSGTACTADTSPCTLDQCDGTNNACQHPAGNAGVTCRPKVDSCDVAETCTGTSTTCPPDAFQSSTTVCRLSAGACDPAELCTGTGVACPADTLSSSSVTCRSSAGECDPAENCTGSSPTCPGDAKTPSGTACTSDGNPCTIDQCDGSSDGCQHPAGNAGTVCRPGSGDVCDPDEVCTGVSATCPSDVFLSSTSQCRAAAGECDVAETCPGAAGQPCPADAKKPSGTACTADANPCTLDQCDGTGDVCQHPAGNAGTECRAAAGVCDVAETCSGTSTACPPDAKSTAVCRPPAGPCDASETCDGTGDDCPSDTFQPSSTECRPSAGTCDVAESCTGTDAACPADDVQPSGTSCRPAAGDCDVAETCDGTSSDCPADAFEASTTVCRAAAGPCDAAENCTGTDGACPADAKSTAVCRPAAGDCDVAETCDGVNDTCPADTISSAGTVCRSAAGDCDVAETCDGATTACPPDAVQSGGTVCRSAAGTCDVDETCDGASPACPADAVTPTGTECRASAGPCDVAESCDGTSTACPPDSVAGAFVECRPPAGACDVAENCTGTSTACPADGFQPATFTCRATAGVCDVAESCTGTDAACPADQKSSGVCRPSAGACDVAESCDGSSNGCPVDAFQPVGTTCRSATGVCDVAEVCTGLSPTCPADLAAPDGTPCNDSNVCTSPDQCQAGACTGPFDPTQCSDHYLCYKVKAPTFSTSPTVTLADAFDGSVSATSLRARQLCTPASKNGSPVTDDTTHLTAYSFRQSPAHTRRTISSTDQFGTLSLSTIKPDTLLVPSNKDLNTTPSAPDQNAINVDHYKCYKVKVTPGTPKFTTVQVSVADQFNAPPKLFDVRKPKHFCNAVDKNGEGFKNANARLVCYQVKGSKGQPKHVRRTVFINNQFGPAPMTTVKERELCLPAVTN